MEKKRPARGFMQYQHHHLGNNEAFILIKGLFIADGSRAIMMAFDNRQSNHDFSTKCVLLHNGTAAKMAHSSRHCMSQ